MTTGNDTGKTGGLQQSPSLATEPRIKRLFMEYSGGKLRSGRASQGRTAEDRGSANYPLALNERYPMAQISQKKFRKIREFLRIWKGPAKKQRIGCALYEHPSPQRNVPALTIGPLPGQGRCIFKQAPSFFMSSFALFYFDDNDKSWHTMDMKNIAEQEPQHEETARALCSRKNSPPQRKKSPPSKPRSRTSRSIPDRPFLRGANSTKRLAQPREEIDASRRRCEKGKEAIERDRVLMLDIDTSKEVNDLYGHRMAMSSCARGGQLGRCSARKTASALWRRGDRGHSPKTDASRLINKFYIPKPENLI